MKDSPKNSNSGDLNLQQENKALRAKVAELERLHIGLKNAEEALDAERELLMVTLRSIGDGVITTDTKGVVTMLNPVAEDLTGWRIAEAKGHSMDEVFNIIEQDSRNVIENPALKVLHSGTGLQLSRQTLLISKTGTERVIADSCAPIRDSKNNIVGVVLVFRDITTEAHIQSDIQRAAKLESIGVLAGGIAHDFNNLLAAITGNAGLAQMALFSNDTPRAQLSLIEVENAAIRARDLTQQLLTFAQGGAPIKSALALEPLLHEAAAFSLSGSRNRCRVEASNLWPINADPSQISQVINNILINADQAMTQGGDITIKAENVKVSAAQNLPLSEGAYIKISVSDQGEGIAPEIMGRIFDPFFTTKERGSGLGLTSAYSILKAHGGHISASSTPGEGTTFTVYLPARPDLPIEEEKRGTAKTITRSLNILVMDDEEMIRHLLRETLCTLGHCVTTASDGEEAIAEYESALKGGRHFDLVVLDLTIQGGLGGKETLEALLKLDPEVKAIASSGYATDPIMANCTDYGFSGRLAKPYRISDLQEIIESTCGLPGGLNKKAGTRSSYSANMQERTAVTKLSG